MATARSTFAFLALCGLLAGCVVSPHSRIAAESSAPVTLSGYAPSGGETITIQAVDQNTGALATLGTVPSSMSGSAFKTSTGTPYTLFPWSFQAGVLPPHYWSPQTIVPGLATGQGHLELVASGGGSGFDTFSTEAAASVSSAMKAGTDPATAGNKFSDGKSTVLFDQTGVSFGAASQWTNVQGMISNSNSPYYSPVAWSLGTYTVEGDKKIYGLICAPATAGSYPVVIYNHGGTDRGDVDTGGMDLGNGGGLSGNVTASGWTSQPFVATPLAPGGIAIFPDSLGQCVDWAKRGWIFATSAYRGEQVRITSASPSFPAVSKTSGGLVELCSGEVTDVLALADLLANHASAIKVGGTGQPVTLSTNGKMLMYGYSHGGCITYRAVEQGAPVNAFSVTEGFADFRLTYMNVFDNAVPAKNADLAALGSGAGVPSAADASGGFYYPDANGVMGYNWRSAHYFASRGDLSIRKFKTMPILIFHGDVDMVPGDPAPLLNPVFLDEATEIARDIGATNIFVGPGGAVAAPGSEPCIAGDAGAPFMDAKNPPKIASCPVSFTAMDTGDPCLSPNPTGVFSLCKVLMLPLAPPSGQDQQLHYLVVYHNMNHVNGGLAIKETFNRFAEQNFLRQPGCDGLQIDCASD
ncbi:MAG TPA: hypothetical protein VG889_02090 [Rhizomicrobium sp.]|nr:hypothetical protein [Rhizomicrobium sp.]